MCRFVPKNLIKCFFSLPKDSLMSPHVHVLGVKCIISHIYVELFHSMNLAQLFATAVLYQE